MYKTEDRKNGSTMTNLKELAYTHTHILTYLEY